MTNQSVEHQKLVNAIYLKVGSMPEVRLCKNATGVARSMDGQRVISFGLKGSSDLIGLLYTGRALCIEAKTGDAVQTKDQKNFEKMVVKFNGVYILARSVSDAIEGVRKALRVRLK